MHTIKTQASDKCICLYICAHQKATGEGIRSTSGGLAQQYCSGCAASATKFFMHSCEIGDGYKCCEHKCCMHQMLYPQDAVCTKYHMHRKPFPAPILNRAGRKIGGMDTTGCLYWRPGTETLGYPVSVQ